MGYYSLRQFPLWGALLHGRPPLSDKPVPTTPDVQGEDRLGCDSKVFDASSVMGFVDFEIQEAKGSQRRWWKVQARSLATAVPVQDTSDAANLRIFNSGFN